MQNTEQLFLIGRNKQQMYKLQLISTSHQQLRYLNTIVDTRNSYDHNREEVLLLLLKIHFYIALFINFLSLYEAEIPKKSPARRTVAGLNLQRPREKHNWGRFCISHVLIYFERVTHASQEHFKIYLEFHENVIKMVSKRTNYQKLFDGFHVLPHKAKSCLIFS